MRLDQPRGNRVAVLERQVVLARQRVREFGQRDPVLAGAHGHQLAVEVGPAHRRRDEARGPVRVAEGRVDERLQVVLGVHDVAERRVVDGHHRPRRLADGLARQRARVLQRDRVALLRHDAAALHETVRQPQVLELQRAPEQQVLDHAAEPHQHHGRGGQRLQRVVDRGDAAVGVPRRPAEAEQRGRAVPVDREARPGDGARAQRVPVGRGVGRRQPRPVPSQLLDDAEQVVRDGAGLRRLRVGVRGEHGLAVPLRDVDHRGPQGVGRLEQVQDPRPLPDPVHRHVDVVAAAGGVQAPRHLVAARLDDEVFDVEEEVLARLVELHATHVGFRDAVQGVSQGGRVGGRDDALLGEHHQVRVVDRQQRREEQRLRVLEVLVEDVSDVFGRELHGSGEYIKGGWGCPLASGAPAAWEPSLGEASLRGLRCAPAACGDCAERLPPTGTSADSALESLGDAVETSAAARGTKDEGRRRQPEGVLASPKSCLRDQGMTKACSVCRTVITGQCALRTTRSATLPSSMCAMAPRPWVPRTMRSIFSSRA